MYFHWAPRFSPPHDRRLYGTSHPSHGVTRSSFFHVPPPNCTFWSSVNLDSALRDYILGGERFSAPPQPGRPSGDAPRLWSRGRCWGANISLSSKTEKGKKKKKREMPNASRTRCRDTLLSLALSQTRRQPGPFDAFKAEFPSDWTPIPPQLGWDL